MKFKETKRKCGAGNEIYVDESLYKKRFLNNYLGDELNEKTLRIQNIPIKSEQNQILYNPPVYSSPPRNRRSYLDNLENWANVQQSDQEASQQKGRDGSNYQTPSFKNNLQGKLGSSICQINRDQRHQLKFLEDNDFSFMPEKCSQISNLYGSHQNYHQDEEQNIISLDNSTDFPRVPKNSREQESEVKVVQNNAVFIKTSQNPNRQESLNDEINSNFPQLEVPQDSHIPNQYWSPSTNSLEDFLLLESNKKHQNNSIQKERDIEKGIISSLQFQDKLLHFDEKLINSNNLSDQYALLDEIYKQQLVLQNMQINKNLFSQNISSNSKLQLFQSYNQNQDAIHQQNQQQQLQMHQQLLQQHHHHQQQQQQKIHMNSTEKQSQHFQLPKQYVRKPLGTLSNDNINRASSNKVCNIELSQAKEKPITQITKNNNKENEEISEIQCATQFSSIINENIELNSSKVESFDKILTIRYCPKKKDIIAQVKFDCEEKFREIPTSVITKTNPVVLVEFYQNLLFGVNRKERKN